MTTPGKVRYALNVSGHKGSRRIRRNTQQTSGYSVPGHSYGDRTGRVQVMWRPGDHVPESEYDEQRQEALDAYAAALVGRGFSVERHPGYLTVTRPESE